MQNATSDDRGMQIATPVEERRKRRTMGARTGGRSERVVREVLRAAIEELTRIGFEALRVEEVAARAGVNKTTVYRRWPTKIDLVSAAIQSRLGYRDPLPDTGTLRGDVLEMIRTSLTVAASPEGRGYIRLATPTGTDPDIDRLAKSLHAAARARRAQLVARAQSRGLLSNELDAALVSDMLFMPVMTRVTRYGEEVDMATAESLVDLALHGIARAGKPLS